MCLCCLYLQVTLSGAETALEIAEFVMKALRFCPDWATIEILPTLVVLIEDYGQLFFQVKVTDLKQVC